MRAPPTRTLTDKAHRVVVAMLGVVTVASAGFFGANAFSIMSHVYSQEPPPAKVEEATSKE